MNHSEFYNRTRSVDKIMVVDFGFLGDSVHLVPALWELKRHYPQSQLHTLSATVGAELLKMAPCVDRVWAFPLTPKRPPWWRHWDIFLAIRREKFDLAINFNGTDRTIFVSRLTGAKWRLAHEGGGRKHFWKRWLIPYWVPRQSRKLPIFEQRRQVLAACGCSLAPARFDLAVPKAAQIWAENQVPGTPVHISINASTPLKEWPLEHWISLARCLLQRDPSLQLVVTTSAAPRELGRMNALAKAVNNPRLQCFEAPSIGQLSALLQRCKLHVGVDSGALHLAMALGIPTFTIFRNYDGLQEWRAIGPQHRYIDIRCACNEGEPTDCKKLQKALCLQSVTPEQVFSQVSNQLATQGCSFIDKK